MQISEWMRFCDGWNEGNNKFILISKHIRNAFKTPTNLAHENRASAGRGEWRWAKSDILRLFKLPHSKIYLAHFARVLWHVVVLIQITTKLCFFLCGLREINKTFNQKIRCKEKQNSDWRQQIYLISFTQNYIKKISKKQNKNKNGWVVCLGWTVKSVQFWVVSVGRFDLHCHDTYNK